MMSPNNFLFRFEDTINFGKKIIWAHHQHFELAYIDCDYIKSSGLKNPNGCLQILSVLHSNNTQAVWKIVIVVFTFYEQVNKGILYAKDPYNYVLWTLKKNSTFRTS